jgi:hypothetical protein
LYITRTVVQNGCTERLYRMVVQNENGCTERVSVPHPTVAVALSSRWTNTVKDESTVPLVMALHSCPIISLPIPG